MAEFEMVNPDKFHFPEYIVEAWSWRKAEWSECGRACSQEEARELIAQASQRRSEVTYRVVRIVRESGMQVKHELERITREY